MSTEHVKIAALLLTVTLLLGACSAKSPPVSFYTLSTLPGTDQTAAPASRAQTVSIGIGPVQLPELLDRPQIVTRSSANRIQVAEFHRWGGALKEEVIRVLVENITQLTGVNQVLAFPWGAFEPTYRVVVDIQQFDGPLGGSVRLKARWSIISAQGSQSPPMNITEITATVSGASHEDQVAAHSQALGRLSREIAAALLKMLPP